MMATVGIKHMDDPRSYKDAIDRSDHEKMTESDGG